MHALYVFSVWLHILAVTAWIGSMAFIMGVLVPWMRKGNRAQGAALLRATGPRLRSLGWWCFAIVLVTGSFQLYMRGVAFSSFFDAAWRASAFGKTVILKLAVFACVLVLSAVHDFMIGPRAAVVMTENPGSIESETLRRRASIMGRSNAVLALVLVLLGVMIVRGVPW